MPNLNLLDRFLLMMEWQNVETIICFSKQDIVSEEEEKHFLSIYEKCANQVLTVSNTENMGIDKVKQCLEGKTTVLAGPSGVGKSSLLNCLCPKAASVTGSVSEEIWQRPAYHKNILKFILWGIRRFCLILRDLVP